VGWVEGGTESATAKQSGIKQHEEELGLKTDWGNWRTANCRWQPGSADPGKGQNPGALCLHGEVLWVPSETEWEVSMTCLQSRQPPCSCCHCYPPTTLWIIPQITHYTGCLVWGN